jgi:hypothetical protein
MSGYVEWLRLKRLEEEERREQMGLGEYDEPEQELRDVAWLLVLGILSIAIALIALGYCVGRLGS